eukprot:gene16500-biopygen5042
MGGDTPVEWFAKNGRTRNAFQSSRNHSMVGEDPRSGQAQGVGAWRKGNVKHLQATEGDRKKVHRKKVGEGKEEVGEGREEVGKRAGACPFPAGASGYRSQGCPRLGWAPAGAVLMGAREAASHFRERLHTTGGRRA